MKRDEMVLPEAQEQTPKPAWKLDPVREAMNYYDARWPDELRKLIERMQREINHLKCELDRKEKP
jgi:hypothetical protein